LAAAAVSELKGVSMIRILPGLTVPALAGVLSFVLIGHLWNRYSEETQALGFSGVFERFLAAQAGFADDVNAYRASASRGDFVQKASALEE
jgi:hypothetical protein